MGRSVTNFFADRNPLKLYERMQIELKAIHESLIKEDKERQQENRHASIRFVTPDSDGATPEAYYINQILSLRNKEKVL